MAERSINDNVMATIEIVHYMKLKTHGKVDDIDLKLDISKVYDQIGWEYFKDAMCVMRFAD